MNNRILFSPVGGTDPISNYHDGALLHICRFYKPNIVYLYLSGEIAEYHNKDNRYLESIQKLGVELVHSFEVHIIEKPELFNVQIFDDFLEEFRRIISDIMRGREESELLLNVSSGTPAMKGALQTLSVFLTYKNIAPIQVSTPKRRMNFKTDDRNDFDVELQWEFNEDNLKDAENRCTVSGRVNLLVETQKRIIEKHLHSYNYQGAIEATKEIENYIPKDLMNLLRGALCRLQYNLEEIEKYVDPKKYNLFVNIPIKNKHLYEYLLNLKIKLTKEEYADFIRAISPYFQELLKIIIDEGCSIDLAEYMNVKKLKAGEEYWDLRKVERNPELMGAFDEKFGKDRFEGRQVKSVHLMAIIDYFIEDERLRNEIHYVREAEERIRNVAAHQLAGIGKNVKNYNMNEILNKLKFLSVQAGLALNNDVWNSYDYMNDLLIELLYKQN